MIRRLGLLFLLAIAAAGGFAAWLDPRINKPYKGYPGSEIFIDIPKGTSRWQVSGMLARDHVIRNRVAFELLSRFHERYALQAGEYRFDHPMNAREVFWTIAKGRIFLYTLTVPEGWTMFDIGSALQRLGLCSRDDFVRAARDTSPIADIAPHAHSLEGFLFPSTYQFKHQATPEQVVAEMVRKFRNGWQSIDPGGAVPMPDHFDIQQVVTLASLVERETPQPSERPIVAGVFYNRLAKGYALQCDPTVQYALELQGKTVRNIAHADLSVDSPYNTYEHSGLPPGPIANPGEASLRAALEPAHTDYFYFVANDAGGHFFSRTLAEHNRNVARYRHMLGIGMEPVDANPGSKKRRGGS